MHCIGNFGSSCEFWRLSLEKPTEIHHNSGVSAVCANYDGFLWLFPRKVVRIRLNSRNSLYNAPAKKVSKSIGVTNFTSVTPENSWGIHCVVLMGPIVLPVLLFTGTSPRCSSPSSGKKSVSPLYRAIRLRFIRVARLQSEFWHEIFFGGYEISHEKCSEIFPRKCWAFICGSKKSRKIPAKFPTKFPSQKSRKVHRRASAGAQGERFRYRFESCDANGQRNVKNANPEKQKALFFHHSSLLALRHLLPVQRQILRTGRVHEKIVQNLCAGHSRQIPEILCKKCAGASKNVLRLCEICAGGSAAQFTQNIGVGLPRMRVHKFRAIFHWNLNFSLRPGCTGKKMSQC